MHLNKVIINKQRITKTLRGIDRVKYLDLVKIHIIETYRGKEISLVDLERELKIKFPDITKSRIRTAMSNLILKGYVGSFNYSRIMYRVFK